MSEEGVDEYSDEIICNSLKNCRITENCGNL
jgi:hypothetical protein